MENLDCSHTINCVTVALVTIGPVNNCLWLHRSTLAKNVLDGAGVGVHV